MALKFQAPNIERSKTPEEAFIEPVTQAVQTLPALWAQYRMQRRQQELQDMELGLRKREIQARFGTGSPAPIQPGTLAPPSSATNPDTEEQYFGMGGTPAGPAVEPAEDRLRRVGSETYGSETARLKALKETPPNSLDNILAQRVQEGKLTLEQAMELKAKSQGVSPGLEFQMRKDKEKKEADLKELQVPGYALGDEVRPTQKEAQDLRTASGAMADFSKGVDRMVELIRKHGSTKLTGQASGEMETLAANLKLTLKEVQKLGVLSASDIAFLEAQIFDPSRVKSIFRRTPTAIKQLETAKERAQSLLSESLKSRGYGSAATGTKSANDPLGIR